MPLKPIITDRLPERARELLEKARHDLGAWNHSAIKPSPVTEYLIREIVEYLVKTKEDV